MSVSAQHAALLAELDGVELGAYDRLIIGWLSQLDYSSVAAVASLIRRAAQRSS